MVNSFDFNYIPILIINFIFSIIIFIIFYSIFYILNRVKIFHYIIKLNHKYIYIWWSLIGIFITLINLLSLLPFMENNNLFLVSNSLVYSIIFSPIIAYISLPLTIIINLIFFSQGIISLDNFLSLLIISSSLLLFSFIAWIFNNKSNFIYFIYVTFITIFMMLSIRFIPNEYIYAIILNIFLFVYMILSYAVIKPFTKFILNAKNINDKTYMVSGFILNKYFKNIFKKFINEKKVQYGCLFLIELDSYDKIANLFSAALTNKIKQEMLHQIKDLFKNDSTIFFITENNKYCFFTKLDDVENIQDVYSGNYLAKRKNTDLLHIFESKLKSIPNTLKINDNYFKTPLKMSGALYGIQNNDINELISKCEKLNITQYDDQNINLITLYNSNIIDNKDFINIKNNILIKNSLFQYNEIDIKYEIININNIKYYSTEATLFNKLIFSKKDIINLSNLDYVRDAIISHISALAIKNFNHIKYPLIIDYDKYSISSLLFDVKLFLLKIETYNNLKNNFLLNIICDDNIFNEIFIKNISILVKNKIKIFISFNKSIDNKDIIINSINKLKISKNNIFFLNN